LATRAEIKTASLLQNPLRGGIPDREAVAIAIRINVVGIYFLKPLEEGVAHQVEDARREACDVCALTQA
jgi:hypothetical protein